MANPWIKSWEVTGTSGKVYKVSQRADGSYGCECPAWKFQPGHKNDCQHILQVKLNLVSNAATAAAASSGFRVQQTEGRKYRED